VFVLGNDVKWKSLCVCSRSVYRIGKTSISLSLRQRRHTQHRERVSEHSRRGERQAKKPFAARARIIEKKRDAIGAGKKIYERVYANGLTVL
jgi:hypothetical protein